ncbi:hypothetical protein [Mucilaginibacter sp. RCC_168]|uniref:hypothetical protein n=1 Tax=Mucilaginibacter sp. RCC_168 TaxID=3239221 RepID=UPI003525CDEA
MRVAHVLEVYNSIKERDIPDTRVLTILKRDHNILISYRTLMNYKGKKPSELNTNQLSIFDIAS